ATRELLCGIGTADAVRHLDELRELREPCRERDVVPAQIPRPAAPVPLLVRGAERVEHPDGQTELLAERAGDRGVVRHHPVEVAMTRDRELEPDTEPVQQRIARPEETECRDRTADAPELVV